MAFERERVVRRAMPMSCPVCFAESELLTAGQAATLAQVNVHSIYRWLAEGKAHGVKTTGGEHRICKDSLFKHC